MKETLAVGKDFPQNVVMWMQNFKLTAHCRLCLLYSLAALRHPTVSAQFSNHKQHKLSKLLSILNKNFDTHPARKKRYTFETPSFSDL